MKVGGIINFTPFKVIMFLISFTPLWISIIVLDIFTIIQNCAKVKTGYDVFRNNPLEIWSVSILFLLVTITLVFLELYMHRLKEEENQKVKIINIERQRGISYVYLLLYMLPLIAFNFSDVSNVVVFAIYMFIVGFVCVKNNNIYANIILEFKGYSALLCDIEVTDIIKEKEKRQVLLISKYITKQYTGQEVNCYSFDNECLINFSGLD